MRPMLLACLAGLALSAGSAGAAETAADAPDPPAAKAETARGVFRFVIDLQVGNGVPDGASVSLAASAFAKDASYDNSSTVSVSAPVRKGKAKVEISVPYRWVFINRKSRVSLRVDASTYDDGTSVSRSFDDEVALPKNGDVTTVRISSGI